MDTIPVVVNIVEDLIDIMMNCILQAFIMVSGNTTKETMIFIQRIMLYVNRCLS